MEDERILVWIGLWYHFLAEVLVDLVVDVAYGVDLEDDRRGMD